MSLANIRRPLHCTDDAVQPPSVVNQQPPEPKTSQVALNPSELRRFLERQRARELGSELPLNTREAAAHINYHPKTVERMAREGDIPAHPISGVRRKTWRFFASELDTWLRAKVSSPRHPCSPDGKDTLQ